MELIRKYFQYLSEDQIGQFNQIEYLYRFWNEHINVISRADIDNLEERHILHSLAIGKICRFDAGTRVVDIGTGGGFPGIPLAIMFPKTHFHLIDSIGKKIKVVNTIVTDLGLMNVKAEQIQAEELTGPYDFLISRAVTKTKYQLRWAKKLLNTESGNELPNGLILLKGGDLSEELSGIEEAKYEFAISDFFEEQFFETKKIVYITV